MISAEASAAAFATVFLPVAISDNIVCRVLAFSTSTHLIAPGTNHEFLAAAATGAAFPVIKLSILVLFGIAPLLAMVVICVEFVK